MHFRNGETVELVESYSMQISFVRPYGLTEPNHLPFIVTVLLYVTPILGRPPCFRSGLP